MAAELGAGMEATYHRRVTISAKDVAGTAFTRVANGLNGLGYYMFHGGHNLVGATALQESRISGYPNDLPYINYDYQSPIGDMESSITTVLPSLGCCTCLYKILAKAW
ncbi:MAG: hypothetical protein WDM90_11735 [Ferruginibacter sp.]